MQKTNCPHLAHIAFIPRVQLTVTTLTPVTRTQTMTIWSHGFSPFTFHLGFVHPLQDVALHQCHPLSSVAFLIQVVPSFFAMSSCHLLPGHPLDLFPLLSCHSVGRLVHLSSSILAMCPAHFHFCFRVYSIMSIILNFVLFLIPEHDILSCSLFVVRKCLSFWCA